MGAIQLGVGDAREVLVSGVGRAGAAADTAGRVIAAEIVEPVHRQRPGCRLGAIDTGHRGRAAHQRGGLGEQMFA